MAGSSSSKGIAKLVQSAICKTNVRYRPSPSLFVFPGLSSSPLINPEVFPVTKVLEDNKETILREYHQLRAINAQKNSDYVSTEEHKLNSGSWDWNSYVVKGKRQSDFTINCPKTVEILESMNSPSLMTNTPFSFAFFSTLKGGTTIAPHYGPCNLRIRCHLPLLVPEGDCGMRIGPYEMQWEEGKAIYFDDCYEHEGMVTVKKCVSSHCYNAQL